MYLPKPKHRFNQLHVMICFPQRHLNVSNQTGVLEESPSQCFVPDRACNMFSKLSCNDDEPRRNTWHVNFVVLCPVVVMSNSILLALWVLLVSRIFPQDTSPSGVPVGRPRPDDYPETGLAVEDAS